MKPLQVWLPTLDPALTEAKTRLDLERAQLSWSDQISIWTLPGNGGGKLWACPDQAWATESAIQGQHLNRFDVFHICPDGYAHGRHSCQRFPNQNVEMLLSEWLNIDPRDPQSTVRLKPVMPSSMNFRIPDFKDGKMGYRGITMMAAQPLGTMPASFKDPAGLPSSLKAMWPPPGVNNGLVISPSAESEDQYGPWKTEFMECDGWSIPTLVSRKNPNHRSGLWLDVWPGNLQRFFPFGGGLDAIHANQTMRRIAEASAEEPVKALTEARDRSTRFLSKARTTLWNSWFVPILVRRNVEEALFAIEAKYSLEFQSLHEAMASDEFREEMRSTIEIQRALGVVGLFWALLIEQLEEGHSFQTCEWCRRLIRGRADKRFCNKQENPDCWRKRRSANRRRQRTKGKKRT